MKTHLTIVFYIVMACSVATAYAQFPNSNFARPHKNLPKPQNPAQGNPSPTVTPNDMLSLDMSQAVDVITKAISDYKAKIDKLALNSAADYANVDPQYALTIETYLTISQNTVETYIGQVQSAKVTSIDDINKNNTILLNLEALDSDIHQIVLQYKGVGHLTTTTKPYVWFPARNYQFARIVYNTVDSSNFSFGNSFTFMGSDNEAAINPEIVAGFFGPVRVSINTLISTTKDTSVAAQTRLRLISGGGNTAITFSYAIFRYVTSDVNILIHLNPKFIADFPLLGNSSITGGAFVGSVSLAPEAVLKVNTNEKNMGFFADVRAATIFGTTQYLTNLALNPHIHKFDFGQINAGLFVTSSFQVSVTAPLYASYGSLLRTPVLLTTQIFPGASKSH